MITNYPREKRVLNVDNATILNRTEVLVEGEQKCWQKGTGPTGANNLEIGNNNDNLEAERNALHPRFFLVLGFVLEYFLRLGSEG